MDFRLMKYSSHKIDLIYFKSRVPYYRRYYLTFSPPFFFLTFLIVDSDVIVSIALFLIYIPNHMYQSLGQSSQVGTLTPYIRRTKPMIRL